MISRNPQDNLPLRVALISLSMEKDKDNPEPKILYKYRKLSSAEDVRRFFDIIANGRLYAAPLEKLNDPFEGAFSLSGISKQRARELKQELKNTLVCSLTTVKDNKVMWNAYADSFSGCCIELEIPSPGKWRRLKVEYVGERPTATNVDDILRVKSQGWGYEKEVRYVKYKNPHDTKYYLKVKVRKVYFGCAMSKKMIKEYAGIISHINKGEITCDTLSKKDLKYCSSSDLAWDAAQEDTK